MLTAAKDSDVASVKQATLSGATSTVTDAKEKTGNGIPIPDRIARVLRIVWLGQTVASVCWICSVFAYGISSIGDWLQLLAASAWLVANVAAVLTIRAD